MKTNLNDTTVVHNEVVQRFEMEIEGLRALLTYRRFPDRIVLVHTEVPAPLEGKGLGTWRDRLQEPASNLKDRREST